MACLNLSLSSSFLYKSSLFSTINFLYSFSSEILKFSLEFGFLVALNSGFIIETKFIISVLFASVIFISSYLSLNSKLKFEFLLSILSLICLIKFKISLLRIISYEYHFE